VSLADHEPGRLRSRPTMHTNWRALGQQRGSDRRHPARPGPRAPSRRTAHRPAMAGRTGSNARPIGVLGSTPRARALGREGALATNSSTVVGQQAGDATSSRARTPSTNRLHGPPRWPAWSAAEPECSDRARRGWVPEPCQAATLAFAGGGKTPGSRTPRHCRDTPRTRWRGTQVDPQQNAHFTARQIMVILRAPQAWL
jgi:hypothetical protein